MDLAHTYDNRYANDSESQNFSLSIEEMEDDDGGRGEKLKPCVAELEAWDMRQLECFRQLGRWEVRGPAAVTCA